MQEGNLHHYIQILRNECLKVHDRQPFYVFIYSQRECTTLPIETRGHRLVFKKCLNQIQWHNFDPDTTLFVDDSEEKLVDNPPNTYIVPTTYKGDPSDSFLLSHLLPYMRQLAEPGTVSDFVSQNKLIEEH